VIKPFLDFLRSFDALWAHNMMAIMLDPRFNALWIVESLVVHRNVIRLTSKYDDKIVIMLLMVCFEQLNLSIVVVVTTTNDEKLELEENMFRIGASIEEYSQALVTTKLSLFRKFSISSSACANLVIWWHMHEGQFPNGFSCKTYS